MRERAASGAWFRSVAAVAVFILAAVFPLSLAQAQVVAPNTPMAPAAPAMPGAGNPALSQFAGCMAGSDTADLLIIMDQSGSLVQDIGANPATDPEHLRVEAAKHFVAELAEYGADAGVDIRVRTAGFGEAYYADEAQYGGWNSLAAGLGPVHRELEKFRERTNDGFTQYPDALSGALSTSATAESPCQAVMFFTDGMMTMADQDLTSATQQLCSAEGPVAQLRRAGIQIFSVGLSAGGSQDMSLLRAISESSTDCGGSVPANGQYMEGADAAGLLAAFHTAIPNPAGYSEENIPVNDFFTFYLDNSVSPVRLAAQPEASAGEGTLVPVLTPRGGEPVQLEPGEQTIGGAVVDVDFNDNVPGVVDITMDRSADWAGEWAFGYQDPADENLSYRAQLTIHPGMSLLVSSEDSDPNGGLRSTNTSPLTVQIIDSAGNPQPLAGEATLSATFRSNGTGELNLARDIPAGAGQAVDVPLAQIEQPSSGTLSLRVDITTEGPEGGAGTDLDPLMFESPLSVTLESLPQLPPNIDLGQISEETITVEVPVTGPGRVWVEAMPLAEASLPDGIALTVSSSADSFEDAVVLEQDEDGVVPLTVQSTGLADGPVTGALTVHYADLEDTDRGSSEVPVRGAMRVPVDGVAFTATFFGALLLALLIPLGVLYLMKYITGRIPTKPRLNVVRVPVTLDQGTLRRTDTDAPFEVEYRELGSRPALEPDPRSLQMPGAALQVKLGWNPFQPAYAEADADLSIADDGRRAGSRARLPVVVHNRWFMMLEPEPTAKAYVYLLVDETSSAENLKSMVSEVQARGPERFRQLRQDQIRQSEDLNAALAPEPVAATSMAPAFGRRPEAPSTSPSSPRPGSAAPPTSDETPTDPFAKGKKSAQSPPQSQGQFGKFGHFGGGQFGKFGQFGGGDFPGNGAGPNTDPFHKGPEHPQSGAGENPGGRPSR